MRPQFVIFQRGECSPESGVFCFTSLRLFSSPNGAPCDSLGQSPRTRSWGGSQALQERNSRLFCFAPTELFPSPASSSWGIAPGWRISHLRCSKTCAVVEPGPPQRTSPCLWALLREGGAGKYVASSFGRTKPCATGRVPAAPRPAGAAYSHRAQCIAASSFDVRCSLFAVPLLFFVLSNAPCRS
jgi:hypothetical protein